MAPTSQFPRNALLAWLLLVASPGMSLGQAPDLSAPSPLAASTALLGHELRGLRPAVVSQILTGEAGGDIGLAVLTIPTRSDEAGTEVLLFVEIDGADLLSSNRVRTPRLELYTYVLDGSGRISAHLAQAFVLDTTILGEVVWQSGLKFFGKLMLPSGHFEVRILVRNFHSGAKGLHIMPLEVPDWTDVPSVLLPPIFPAPQARDSWLPIDGWRRSHGTTPSVYPFVAEPMVAVDPAALPVVVAGVETQVYLFGHGLPKGKLKVHFRPSDPDSSSAKALASRDVDIVARETSPSSDFEYLLTSFMPPELEPGRFHLQFSFPGKAGESLSSPPIPVLMVHGDVREKGLLWCDLRQMVNRAGATEIPRVASAAAEKGGPEAQPQGRAARRLGKDYRQVLGLLDSDSSETVRMALFELESSALGIGKLKRLNMMRSAELAVAKELSQENPEVLLPILTLHAETHQLYRSRRLYSLTFHARAMVEILAELYADLGGSVATTAKIMASLAGYLQESNLLSSSRRLYQRGLQHDPEARAALLGLAASYEKYGGYGDAIEILERLVIVAPELEEARLRLAINLQRVGRRPRARELLQSIIEHESTTWTSALAYQVIAQEYLEAGDDDRAVELLQQAIDRNADRQALRMLLAHIYDRQGRPRLALEQLQVVAPLSGPGQDSERFLYDSWPTASLDEARREVAIEAQGAVADLVEALDLQSTGS